jgi:transglutaminase-like putative cysteine protease
MIYQLRHRTTYRYDAPVTFAQCVLRLTPTSSPSQTVLAAEVAITPRPARTQKQDGPFGERTLKVLIDQPHTTLVIEARSRVEVHAALDPSLFASQPWEQVRSAGFESGDLGPSGPASFLYPTARTPLSAMITDYARSSFWHGRPILEAVSELMARIHKDFRYDAKATDVFTPAEQAFVARRGVCQDFSHIMICGLRGLGLPAAYVSGYLRTQPPPGRARLQGADATHAWVAVWCGADRGWIGFDPTNNVLAQNDHVVLAVGRDYSDVAPIKGLILTPGDQSLKVEVDVIPEAMPAL